MHTVLFYSPRCFRLCSFFPPSPSLQRRRLFGCRYLPLSDAVSEGQAPCPLVACLPVQIQLAGAPPSRHTLEEEEGGVSDLALARQPATQDRNQSSEQGQEDASRAIFYLPSLSAVYSCAPFASSPVLGAGRALAASPFASGPRREKASGWGESGEARNKGPQGVKRYKKWRGFLPLMRLHLFLLGPD